MMTTVPVKENLIISLRETQFFRRSAVEKKRVKELGPDCPDLNILQQTTDRGRTYTRSISSNVYAKWNWLAECTVGNAFFCFPCVLLKSPGMEMLWTTTGMKDFIPKKPRNTSAAAATLIIA